MKIPEAILAARSFAAVEAWCQLAGAPLSDVLEEWLSIPTFPEDEFR